MVRDSVREGGRLPSNRLTREEHLQSFFQHLVGHRVPAPVYLNFGHRTTVAWASPQGVLGHVDLGATPTRLRIPQDVNFRAKDVSAKRGAGACSSPWKEWTTRPPSSPPLIRDAESLDRDRRI